MESQSVRFIENDVTTKFISSKFEDPYAEDANHGKYWRSLQELKLFRRKKNTRFLAPVDNSTLFSGLLLSWLTPLFKKARTSLNLNDLPRMSKYEQTMHCTQRFLKIDKSAEDYKKKTNIRLTSAKYIVTRFLISVLCLLISLSSAFCASALIMNRFLNYVDDESGTLLEGLGTVAMLMLAELLNLAFHTTYLRLGIRTAVRLRSALSSVIFQKIGRMRSFKNKSIGEIINLMSSDLNRISDCVIHVGSVIASFYILIAITIFSYIELGWTSLVGIFVFVTIAPAQILCGKFITAYRIKSVSITDKRVRIMSEVLNSVKLIKMYAWEKCFTDTTAKVRKSETNILRKMGVVQSVQISISNIVPVLASFLTFSLHTALGYPLDAAKAFTIVGVFNIMRKLLAVLPHAVRAISETKVAFTRIEEIMEAEEISCNFKEPTDSNVAISFNHLTLSWQMQGKNEKQIQLNVLYDLNHKIQKGRLIGICGSIGSGKSSLLSSILGNLQLQRGSLDIGGSLAYVPQQAWIFQGTVRDNILFGSPYDEERFHKAILACCLNRDLEILENGDLTQVGNRGANLSGGQKQRISLARAVYSERDVVLLDDPLSAVDAHVGKHIFFECIRTALRGKTVLFVTHQLQYLKDCDEVILMKEGRFVEIGTYTELYDNGKEFFRMINTFDADMQDTEDCKVSKKENADQIKIRNDSIRNSFIIDESDLYTSESRKTIFSESEKNFTESQNLTDILGVEETSDISEEEKFMQLETKDRQMTGSVGWGTYKAYANAVGIVGVISVLLCYGLMIGCSSLTTWWFSYWLNAGGAVLPCDFSSKVTNVSNSTCNTVRDKNISSRENIEFYQLIYTACMLATVLISLGKALSYTRYTLKASTSLHNKVFTSVLNSPMYFFDTTPIGRLLNRFSRDMDNMDVRFVRLLDNLIQEALAIITALLVMVIAIPWSLVAVVIFFFTFLKLYCGFKPGIQELHRLESKTLSPWLAHISSSVNGLSTIHAYKKTGDMMTKFENLLDNNLQAYFCRANASRWLAIRLGVFNIILIGIIASFVVVSKFFPGIIGKTTASYAGLALTNAIQITGLLQIAVKLSIETESLFTAVERINYYIINCPKEINTSKKIIDVPKLWPEKASIKFNHVFMRYREDLPLVLQDVNINIKPTEKIGVVGRTGSGKSSLGVTLFRLSTIHSGKIAIDGININKISLETLRSRISIIPQEPILFLGTVRYNLDPFGFYSDQKIWDALKLSHMKDIIASLPNKLETQVLENGDNFSVGERQLMCMTRAILRDSRIIMLDEATAAIDSETDSLVQETIRKAFADCTMLTIAHRLNTVLNSDKILVMDCGKVVEFDKPATLLDNHDSYFFKMLDTLSSKSETDSSLQSLPESSTD